jgi:glycosyltransferase involved in cell wall biosynthesis
MIENRMLIIGLVWPEPRSSAAGTRMVQLLELFLLEGYQLTFACAASKSEFSFDLLSLGVAEREIQLNHESFNELLSELRPSLVLFDRFMIEEQYGWRVQQECPRAMRILDTEDLHCLRHTRQQIVKTGNIFKPADLFTDLAKREIASILRSDLSLIISEIEIALLKEQFNVNESLLQYLPFLEPAIEKHQMAKWNTFEARSGFVFIGNFLHEPNWDTVQILKTKIWPLLRSRLPETSMNIYGAYASQKVHQLHNEKERFLVHGRAAEAQEVIAQARVLLAPIQFGAGVKGKFIDAMHCGTPTVTTTVGAEAMKGNLEWNGAVTDDLDDFISKAIQLHEDKNIWLTAQGNGVRILNERYAQHQFSVEFLSRIQELSANLSLHRQRNFFGQILLHHTANSSKYMSLWIQEKNKAKNTEARGLNF